jgi:hypothetical protein
MYVVSTMSGMIQIVIVYNKSNVFGLEKDAQILFEALPLVCKSLGCTLKPIKCMDSREPPIPCDICIHLEVPYSVWFSWAKRNIMFVNSEWWLEKEWSSYWKSFDFAVFRNGTPLLKNDAGETCILPWSTMQKKSPLIPGKRKAEFVWFLGGSKQKRAAAMELLPLWKESYPPLTVYCVEPLSDSLILPSTVSVKVGFLSKEQKHIAASYALGHVCVSKAESFGYTAAEAEEYGAFTILNTLPCYLATYEPNSILVEWIDTPVDDDGFADFSDKTALEKNLDSSILAFQLAISTSSFEDTSKKKRDEPQRRKTVFLKHLESLVESCVSNLDSVPTTPMPPILNVSDCPPISVVTLSYNRPRFIENACLNLLHSDYPRDKIEWIVVDDSDPAESASNRIIQFSEKFTPGIVTYIPLTRKRSVGFKRNLGVERAKHSIILMMDDDDHYPVTSFRRRVAYLVKNKKQYECGVCTTIAMYDLLKGVSAVNVPPYTLSLSKRCSEATLTFTKAFWNAKKFEDVSIAEGEEFLNGREHQVIEIPPQQILVALSHGQNLSSRKMPDTTPGCFWGFSRPLLEFLHGLVGIKIEADENSTSPSS